MGCLSTKREEIHVILVLVTQKHEWLRVQRLRDPGLVALQLLNTAGSKVSNSDGARSCGRTYLPSPQHSHTPLSAESANDTFTSSTHAPPEPAPEEPPDDASYPKPDTIPSRPTNKTAGSALGVFPGWLVSPGGGPGPYRVSRSCPMQPWSMWTATVKSEMHMSVEVACCALVCAAVTTSGKKVGPPSRIACVVSAGEGGQKTNLGRGKQRGGFHGRHTAQWWYMLVCKSCLLLRTHKCAVIRPVHFNVHTQVWVEGRARLFNRRKNRTP